MSLPLAHLVGDQVAVASARSAGLDTSRSSFAPRLAKRLPILAHPAFRDRPEAVLGRATTGRRDSTWRAERETTSSWLTLRRWIFASFCPCLRIVPSGGGTHGQPNWDAFDIVQAKTANAFWVFRKSVTGDFGIVTGGFGNVTGHFGDVTAGPSWVT